MTGTIHAGAEPVTPERVAALVRDSIANREALVKRHDKRVRADAAFLVAFGKANGLRLDANQSMFLARQLLFVRADVEMTIYETLRAKEFVPIDTSMPKWAKDYATERMDVVGEAKEGLQVAHDAPRVDADISEEYGRFVNVTASYGYDLDELEAAAATGRPLTRVRAMACAEAIARKVDKIMRVGSPTVGLTGFFNNPLVPLLTLTYGEWLSTATITEILADFAEMEQALISSTKDGDSLVPGTIKLALPTTVEGVLATKLVDTNVGTTLREHMEAKSRLGTKIRRYIALDSAVAPDVAAVDAPMGILYSAHERNLFCPMPVAYEEFAPKDVDGSTFVVKARSKVGGVDWRRPFTATYVQNFD